MPIDPESYRRHLQMMLLKTDTSPVQHWTQGAARMADGFGTAMLLRREMDADEASRANTQKMLAALLGGGGAVGAAAPPVAAGPAGAPAPMQPILPNRVYSQDEVNPIDVQAMTPQGLAHGVNAPPQYAPAIGKAAIMNDLPPNLLAAQLRQESGFSPDVVSGKRVSSAGAMGISQFMPDTAKEMGINPLDPEQAIPAGARYLRQNIDKFGGSVENGLAAYNWGPARVERWLASGGDRSRLPAETQNYIRSITAGQNAPAPSGQPQVAQAGDPAALPPNAAPTQGYAIPGQPASPPTPAMAQALTGPPSGPQVDPQRMAAITAILMDRRADPAIKQVAAGILQQHMVPQSETITTPDGDIVQIDKRGINPPRLLYKAGVKPVAVPRDSRLINPSTKEVIVDAGQEKPPAGYEWATGAGKKELVPIPGGPESKLPTETAGRIALMDTAMAHVATAREALMKDRGDYGYNNIGSRAGHVAGIGDIGRAQRTVRMAVEAALRMQTGAAAPETEVSRYTDMFTPGPNDSVATSKQKLDALEAFANNARKLIMQGRMPEQAAAAKPDPLGIR